MARRSQQGDRWQGEFSPGLGQACAEWSQGGGKDDSATGVGTEVEKIQEAMEAARTMYKRKVECA